MPSRVRLTQRLVSRLRLQHPVKSQDVWHSGHAIERTEDLIPVLEKCIYASGVHIISVPVDYSGNHRLLEEAVCPD